MGYIKKRAKNQRRRSIWRRWKSGWRPITNYVSFCTASSFREVREVGFDSSDHVTVVGRDSEGRLVRELFSMKPVYAKTFDEVLVLYGLKNYYSVYPRNILKVNHIILPKAGVVVLCESPETCQKPICHCKVPVGGHLQDLITANCPVCGGTGDTGVQVESAIEPCPACRPIQRITISVGEHKEFNGYDPWEEDDVGDRGE